MIFPKKNQKYSVVQLWSIGLMLGALLIVGGETGMRRSDAMHSVLHVSGDVAYWIAGMIVVLAIGLFLGEQWGFQRHEVVEKTSEPAMAPMSKTIPGLGAFMVPAPSGE